MAKILFPFMLVFSTSSTLLSSCAAHRVANQSQLDNFLDKITRNEQVSRMIQLSLTANVYQLNITKFVSGVKENGSLVVEGVEGTVHIICVDEPNLSRKYLQSRRLLNASMVVFDGVVFTGCLLPIYVEQVNTVVIKNCIFQ